MSADQKPLASPKTVKIEIKSPPQFDEDNIEDNGGNSSKKDVDNKTEISKDKKSLTAEDQQQTPKGTQSKKSDKTGKKKSKKKPVKAGSARKGTFTITEFFPKDI